MSTIWRLFFYISIHAPAWGATLTFLSYRLFWQISIHAPAWGATSSPEVSLRQKTDFNPRTRMGCDLKGCGSDGLRADFNPRTRMGCDDYSTAGAVKKGISIHAPAWGATGGRGTARQKRIISIHAPAWGATVISGVLFILVKISIHAPAWGATISWGNRSIPGSFQSTHPHGVRHKS